MRQFILLIVFVFTLFLSCENNNILNPAKQISAIELDIKGLNSLGDSAWYEVWIKGLSRASGSEQETQTSAGVFTVDDEGNLSQTVFDINLGYLQEGLSIYLTVEEDADAGRRYNISGPDTNLVIDTLYEPSKYVIMAAKIKANDGTFSIGHEDIIDYNFNTISGTYLLDTPTDASVSGLSGVWFVNDTSSAGDTKFAGLTLPVLPARWSYEGWAEINGQPISTGKFSNPGSSDKSAQYSGDSLSWAYKFPGEDFINDSTGTFTFPTDLSGANLYVTLEPPHPAKANSPFLIKLLTATIPANAQPKTVYEMQNNFSNEEIVNAFLHLNIKLYD